MINLKNNICLLTLLSWMTALPITSFAAHHQEEKQVTAVKTITVYTVEERNEALMKAKNMLNELDTKIEVMEKELDRKWDGLSEAAKQESRETMKDLRKKRIAVAEWYGGLKRSTDGAWKEVTAGFSNAYQDLERAWTDAKSEF